MTGKRTAERRHTTEYYLALDWLPDARPETSVARAVYDGVAVGSPMGVVVGPGALRLEWFYVRSQ